MRISCFNIQFAYTDNNFEVIQTSPLDFNSTGVVSMVGDNGVGKSTFLRILAGLESPLNGSVMYDEKDIYTSLSELELSRLRSILFTERPSFNWIKVFDILEWTVQTWESDLSRRNKFIDEALEYFAICDLKHRSLDSLSDGQKQKVLLARAFCQNTPIMFLDEPTTFLDIRAKLDVLNRIEQLAQDFNKLVFMCTHEWNWVYERKHRTLFFQKHDNQTTIYDLSPDEIVSREMYPSPTLRH